MSNLKSLAFTSVPKTEDSPVHLRRKKLIERLEEQKALAKDHSHIRLVRKWQKKDGERIMTEKKIPVRPWWKTDEKGQVIFSVLVGYKPVEFEKGKGGILVGSPEKLPAVIDTLVAAVRAGELDSLMEPKRMAQVVAKLKSA